MDKQSAQSKALALKAKSNPMREGQRASKARADAVKRGETVTGSPMNWNPNPKKGEWYTNEKGEHVRK